MSDLKSHLDSIGFRHFLGDDYWIWGGQELSKLILDKDFQKFEKLQHAIQKNPKENKSAFYDFIASKKMQHVVHSMKYQAIFSSGQIVDDHILKTNPSNVLDFGCNSGYLTTWYAKKYPAISFVGVDISEPSITLARSTTQKMSLDNLQFFAGDYQGKMENQFNLVVDTQTICEVFNRDRAINWISNRALSANGQLLSVAQTTNKDELASYINDLNKFGLYIQDLSFISFYDLGQRGCYPVILASKIESEQPDIDGFWNDLYDFYTKM